MLPKAAKEWLEESRDLPLARQQKGIATQVEAVQGFWCVVDMFHFENVGFTNSVDGIKYLTCADCEYGPIGLVDPDSKLNLIAATRLAER
ncbi:unnamed protein product [Caenorhabditis auriculariae]|uniref:Guanine nucleotide exchange factor MSS4 homolog n=1 Tax=Caenorhabditis auriculariae TaxID=2777116 RepID=A0A8S1HEI4_9PELO|nr:unnamed protein product [Caenorhabditis auriculariae]